MKIAALLQMSPLDVLDLLGHSIDRASRCEGLRDRIKATVAAMKNGPAPMDLGVLHEEYTDVEGDYVGIVGKGGACFEQGETGHCPRRVLRAGTKGGGSGKGGKGKGSAAWGAGDGNGTQCSWKGSQKGCSAGYVVTPERPAKTPGQGHIQWPVPRQLSWAGPPDGGMPARRTPWRMGMWTR